jgi:hypothetical protein
MDEPIFGHPSPAQLRFEQFVATERDRFDIRANNTFGIGLWDISIYRDFLSVLVRRQVQASQEGRQAFRRMSEIGKQYPSGARRLSDEEQRLSDLTSQWSLMVRLETEAWYLFAKILLDEIARGIEFYFGAARGCSLQSHDRLTKSLERYANLLGLSLPPRLAQAAADLKQSVADHRDYQVAHHTSLRTIRPLLYGADDSVGARVVHTPLYQGREKQVESGDLAHLTGAIDQYLDLVVDLYESNRDKTCLPLRS